MFFVCGINTICFCYCTVSDPFSSLQCVCLCACVDEKKRDIAGNAGITAHFTLHVLPDCALPHTALLGALKNSCCDPELNWRYL